MRANVVRAGAEAKIEILANDAGDQPLRDIVALVRLAHPTDRRLDQTVEMTAEGAGHFRGTAAFAAGQWDLVIDLDRGGERMFRSRNRVILR